MNICQWKSCVQSGCHVCSQSIKNNKALTIQSVVCNCFNATKRSFCVNMIMDETWIHYFTLESNQLSAEWTAAGESWPKTQTSTSKVLASLFRDAHSILFIDYFDKGRNINSKYYIALLVHHRKKSPKNGHKWRKKCSFTKTMHCVTSLLQRWQNYINCTLNCFPIHPILQIWPPATTGYL